MKHEIDRSCSLGSLVYRARPLLNRSKLAAPNEIPQHKGFPIVHHFKISYDDEVLHPEHWNTKLERIKAPVDFVLLPSKFPPVQQSPL